VKRATDPAFLLSVANHPRNRHYTGAAWGDYDPQRWAKTVALEWPDGGVVFERVSDAAWEGHWCFAPKAKDVVAKGRQAIAYLFSHTNAQRIIGKTPASYRHARKAAEAVGMQVLFTCNGFCHSQLCRADFKEE